MMSSLPVGKFQPSARVSTSDAERVRAAARRAGFAFPGHEPDVALRRGDSCPGASGRTAAVASPCGHAGRVAARPATVGRRRRRVDTIWAAPPRRCRRPGVEEERAGGVARPRAGCSPERDHAGDLEAGVEDVLVRGAAGPDSRRRRWTTAGGADLAGREAARTGPGCREDVQGARKAAGSHPCGFVVGLRLRHRRPRRRRCRQERTTAQGQRADSTRRKRIASSPE